MKQLIRKKSAPTRLINNRVRSVASSLIEPLETREYASHTASWAHFWHAHFHVNKSFDHSGASNSGSAGQTQSGSGSTGSTDGTSGAGSSGTVGAGTTPSGAGGTSSGSASGAGTGSSTGATGGANGGVSQVNSNELPALPTPGGPTGNPNLPADFDAFTAPVTGSAQASSAAPQFAEWTRTAGPDESVAVSIANILANDPQTRFETYGQAGNLTGLLSDAIVRQIDNGSATLTLDANLPAGAMYLLWAHNSTGGWSNPVAINKTDAWWMTARAKPGETASVMGRNLSYHNGTDKSWIYIAPAQGGEGRWINASNVNPYKIDFVVPSDLPAGSYNVWVHNGSGGQYGWSSALNFAVDPAPISTAKTIDVTQDGGWGTISGQDSLDDTDALDRLLTNSNHAFWQDGDTLYFPAGTYLFSHALFAPRNVTLLGSSVGSGPRQKSLSVFSPVSSFANNGTGAAVFWENGNYSGATIKNLTFDITASQAVTRAIDFESESANVTFTNVTVLAGTQLCADIGSATNVRFEGCTFVGQGIFVGPAHDVTIENNAFFAAGNTTTLIYTFGGSRMNISGNTAQNLDPSNPDDPTGAGWGRGRFFVGAGVWGTTHDLYLGDNQTIGFAPPNTGDQNSGETILFEGNQSIYSGAVTRGTANSAQLSGNPYAKLVGYEAIVVSGRGVGQHRTITGYDAATQTITFDVPWNVVPDTTSKISILTTTMRVVTYHNDLSGRADYASLDQASAGVEFFQGGMDLVVANNTFKNFQRGGFSDWAFTYMGLIHPNYFNLFTDNEVIDSTIGSKTVNATVDNGTTAMMGNVYRRNRFANMKDAAVVVFTGSTQNVDPSRWRQAVIEQTQYQVTPVAFMFDSQPYANGSILSLLGNTMLYRNSITT